MIVLKRHSEALHDLSQDEFRELAEIQVRTVRLLQELLNCEKEYLFCFSEAAGFNHIHFHVAPKPRGLPHELNGPAIYAMLKDDGEGDMIPRQEIKDFSEVLRGQFR